MRKIERLKLALRGVGIDKSELDLLFRQIEKVGTAKGFESLGFGGPGSKILNGVVGDRWGFVVGKWIVESIGITDGDLPSWIKIDSSPLHLSRVLNSLEELESLNESNRQMKVEDASQDSKLLRRYLSRENDYEVSGLWGPASDRFIRGLKTEVQEKISSSIKNFLNTQFMQDVIQDKWRTPSQAKKMEYSQALEAWSEKKHKDFPIILEMEGGWKWVDAGGGHSEWVKKNLKNCGTCSWGALGADKELSAESTMYILVDEDFKPHGIATWNPSYVNWNDVRWDESGRKIPVKGKKYLGGIEGVGSRAIKSEYYKYITELVSKLNPDIINISNRSEILEDGRVLDNDNLKKLLPKESLRD